MPNTVRLHRVLATAPEKVYRAFLEADALAKWLPPNGFACTVSHLEPKVGGTFKMSFRNFTTGKSHSFGGEYVELVPNIRDMNHTSCSGCGYRADGRARHHAFRLHVPRALPLSGATQGFWEYPDPVATVKFSLTACPGSPWELTQRELRCNPRRETEVHRNEGYVVNLIWNGNFQSLFLSPLIGAVMGLILTYLFTPPLDYPTNVNIAYTQVVKIFHTEIHHHYHGSKSEDRGAFGFGLILMAVSAWLYLDYGQTVLAVLTFVAAFILVSSATFITMRLLARAGEGWLFRLAWPAVVAILAAILALQEQAVVDYLVANGVNFRYFVSIAGSEFFTTMLYHTAGMLFLVGALAFSIIALLHQIALGTLTDPEDIYSFRGWIIRKTLRIGGPSGFAMSFLFLGMSWLCLSGKALDLVHQLSGR